ncbi:transcription-repair coupling factor [Persicirhabdus sediminis]|uniref:Transcription-repair-coupling factor n=1 Tax=Persicirhabdus sediminis TaxID=454144 RepID=A0A8J7MDV4_9BACT|nr:transcription-repair coupling factor [Persicirhabdus sediminis]
MGSTISIVSKKPIQPHSPGIKKAQRIPAVRQLIDALENPAEIVELDCVADSGYAFILACIRLQEKFPSGRRVCFTHPHPRVRERLASELELWGIKATVVPDIPESNGEGEITAPEIAAERLASLQVLHSPDKLSAPTVFLFSPDALDSPAPVPESLSDGKIIIQLGDELPPEQLEKTLSSEQFEKVHQIHSRGQFARRGGILDVFPWQAEFPYRIEFFDTEVESIREFDLDSQVSRNKCQQAELVVTESQEMATLGDYLSDDDWVISAGDDIPARALAELSDGGTNAPEVIGSPLGHFDAGDFILQETRRHRFFQQIADWRSDDWQIFITFSRPAEQERFEELVDEDFFKNASLTPLIGELVQGFTMPDAKLAFLSSSELFGRYQTPQRRRKLTSQDHQRRNRGQLALEEVDYGDFVVHSEYGIGKFNGIAKDEDGYEEIHILYRDQTTLSVPLDQAHLLTRYVGIGGKTPQLSKIGTTSWGKTRQQAEKSIMDYAAQLLKIQAERNVEKSNPHDADNRWMYEFENSFHFELTPGQRDAIEDVKADMECAKAMDRLICGDVGFGKTEVAIRAAFKSATSGRQVALLCPTTVLAEQHWRTFRERMSDYPLRIELLNRFRKPAEVRETLKGLADGSVDIVIGTHRLISKDVSYKNLGLAIVDEEQRFGVKHKEQFKEIFRQIDVLTLSATPIPRTLYLSMMGARDMSTIDTPLPGKVPIHTSICGYDEAVIKQAIEKELKRGGQVYFLHNRVQTIEMVQKRLQELVPSATCVVGHGQMEKDQLEVVMKSFVQGEADILLATTIIESGIDIPNANTIIIDRADRFGLADLYQLRGRVGRAGGQAYAILLLPSDMIHGDARKRINAIQQYTALGSGFKIAMRDLEIRGAGNLLGTKQSGHIVSIGFDLYCQLLRQSIDRLRGGTVKQRVDVTLRADFLCFNEGDFLGSDPKSNLPCFIPGDYMPDARMRIAAYKELAECQDLRELKKLTARWKDRFGKPSVPVVRLLDTTRLKLIAARNRITSVEIRDQRLKLTRNGEYITLTGKRFPRLTETVASRKLDEAIDWLQKL